MSFSENYIPKRKEDVIEMELKTFHPIVIIIENMHDIIYFIPSDAKSRPQKYHLKEVCFCIKGKVNSCWIWDMVSQARMDNAINEKISKQ